MVSERKGLPVREVTQVRTPTGTQPSRVRRLAAPWLGLALVALLAGLWAGLVLLGLPVPQGRAGLVEVHGPLMALAFLGTLISAERAVALRRRWGYLAPAAAGVGGLAAAAGAPYSLGPALLTVAGLALVAIFGAVWRIQPALHIAVLGIGAACWPVAAGLWLAGWDVPRFVPWLMGFLVLTIAGERLELSRLTGATPGARHALVVVTALLIAGLFTSLPARATGVAICGAALLGTAAWLLRYDLARRTVRSGGVTRYMALSLLTGYGWLAIGGALWLALSRRPGGGLADGPLYDAALHTVFLGFVLSMVFAHAPVIVPAVLRVALPFRRYCYLPLLVLHTSVALRVGGDLLHDTTAWRAGGIGNETALLLFLALAVLTVLRGRRAVHRTREEVG